MAALLIFVQKVLLRLILLLLVIHEVSLTYRSKSCFSFTIHLSRCEINRVLLDSNVFFFQSRTPKVEVDLRVVLINTEMEHYNAAPSFNRLSTA